MNTLLERILAQFDEKFPNLGTDERDLDGQVVRDDVKTFLTTALTSVVEEMKGLVPEIKIISENENMTIEENETVAHYQVGFNAARIETLTRMEEWLKTKLNPL